MTSFLLLKHNAAERKVTETRPVSEGEDKIWANGPWREFCTGVQGRSNKRQRRGIGCNAKANTRYVLLEFLVAMALTATEASFSDRDFFWTERR